MIYNNTANTTTTTELCTATSCPSGSSSPMPPTDGTHTMHITTGGQWNGIYETFNSTTLVSVSMSLKVVSGTVLVELIGAAPPYTYTVVSTSGPMTLAANGAFNEIVIYSASSGAEFYVDNVILTPGGTGTVSITLTSSPPGLGLAIDGIGCTTPCATQTWTAGSTHTIGAGTQPGATGVQYVFTGWADGGTASPRTVTPSVSTTYTANFTTQYLLTTSATAGGTISPGSEWVNAGGVVAVSASANTGYQFTGFSGGALAGNTTPQNLTMNGPANVVANFSQTQVAAPTFSLAPGSYASTQMVSLSTTTQGASIYYTIDGSTPSLTVGMLYNGPVVVATSMTIKAVAVLGSVYSATSSGTYTITVTGDFAIQTSPSSQTIPANVID